MPAALRLETIADIDAFERLAPAWDRLVRAAPRPSPFMLHGWLAEWWRHFGRGRELAVPVVWRDGELAGALPLSIGRRLGVRRAEFLGGHESALGDMLLADPTDSATALALVEAVGGLRLDLLDVFGLPSTSNLGTAAGDRLELLPRVEAPVMTMARPWAELYPAKCNSKKRNLHRRRAKQLAALGTVEWTVAREVGELQGALEDSFALHALRWAGRPDTSTYGSAQGHAFHRAAVERLAPLGVPRIVSLRLDGRPVAFHYFFALEGAMYVHRLAFDPALAECSPGLLTLLETLQVASDEGLGRCEFLGGDERYKLELADGTEPLHQGLGFAGGAVGQVVVRGRLGAVRGRARLKRSPLAQRVWHGQARLRGRVRRPG